MDRWVIVLAAVGFALTGADFPAEVPGVAGPATVPEGTRPSESSRVESAWIGVQGGAEAPITDLFPRGVGRTGHPRSSLMFVNASPPAWGQGRAN